MLTLALILALSLAILRLTQVNLARRQRCVFSSAHLRFVNRLVAEQAEACRASELQAEEVNFT